MASFICVFCVLLQLSYLCVKVSAKDNRININQVRKSNVLYRTRENSPNEIRHRVSEYDPSYPKVTKGIHYKRSFQYIPLEKRNKKLNKVEDYLAETIPKTLEKRDKNNKVDKNLAIGSSDIIHRKRLVQNLWKANIHPHSEEIMEDSEDAKKPIVRYQKQVTRHKHKDYFQKDPKKLISYYGKNMKGQEKADLTTIEPFVSTESRKRDRGSVDALDTVSFAHIQKMEIPSDGQHGQDDTSVADDLAKKVRVLCWVLTHPSNHNVTLEPIKETWGRKCNKLLFMSTKEDKSIPTVKLNVKEGRDYLWIKVKAAILYVYKYYRDEADWFLRADDDTFMVMENLRYMLSSYNPNEPLYFGCRFKPFTTQGYMSGGAGVVLSRAALYKLVKGFTNACQTSEDDENDDVELGGAGVVLSRDGLDKLVSVGLSSKYLCAEPDNRYDDVQLGICLNRIGVKAMDTRDVLKKGRFLPFMPQDHLSPVQDTNFWYYSYTYYPVKPGLACCSDYAISFHYVSPVDMYALEYLIYHIRPFGIQFASARLPQLLTDSQQLPRSNEAIYSENLPALGDSRYQHQRPRNSESVEHPNAQHHPELERLRNLVSADHPNDQHHPELERPRNSKSVDHPNDEEHLNLADSAEENSRDYSSNKEDDKKYVTATEDTVISQDAPTERFKGAKFLKESPKLNSLYWSRNTDVVTPRRRH